MSTKYINLARLLIIGAVSAAILYGIGYAAIHLITSAFTAEVFTQKLALWAGALLTGTSALAVLSFMLLLTGAILEEFIGLFTEP